MPFFSRIDLTDDQHPRRLMSQLNLGSSENNDSPLDDFAKSLVIQVAGGLAANQKYTDMPPDVFGRKVIELTNAVIQRVTSK